MLVLTRRSNEGIRLLTSDGQTIRVKVAGVNGSRVRLAVDAPTEVRIVRDELPPQSPEIQPAA